MEGTYSPEAQSFESDEFSVTASGKDGDGPVNLITFIPRPPTENRGGGCSWSPANFQTGSSGEIAMWCSDSEGDALSAEVIEGPLHGTAGAPAVRPIPYAEFEILIPYTPDAGYEGDDFVRVAVDDGLGSRNEILVEINVTPSPPRPREPRPEVTPLPIPRPEDLAPQGTTGGRALARQVLGTQRVRRVRTPAAEVWAARRLSRGRLLRTRRAPGLLVLCKRRCRLRSESRLVTSRPVGGSGRPYRSAMTAQRRSGRLIWVVTSGADRRALRRGVAPRAAFKLGLRPAGRTRSRLRHTIRVGR